MKLPFAPEEYVVSKGSPLPPIRTEAELMAQMTAPTPAACEAVQALDGDVMVLGVAGKMGPTLAELLVRAGAKRVIGVSRFSSPDSRRYLDSVGVETVACDLLDDKAVAKLPDAPNLFLLAGFKFGSSGAPSLNWAMNTLVPAKLMERFPNSRMVYVSSGNVYKFMPVDSSGAAEDAPLGPVGEYAESRLGGERLVEYYSEKNNTTTLIVRLFYATELRYGIILDIATKVKEQTPIDLAMGYANQIWQGDACDMLVRSFPLCASPAGVINLTGTETLSVRAVAESLGERLGVEPVFTGEPESTALLGDASRYVDTFGAPQVPAEQIIEWVAWWVKHEGSTLGKPTKYESRTGNF
jgi:nucleoside-diphosphate-sugar epimerase